MLTGPFLVALVASTAAPPPVVSPNHPTAVAQAVALADRAAARRGGRSEVLVLGTAHLSSLPKNYDRRRFDGLIERLAIWRPDRIAIESVSGAQCDHLRAYAFVYEGTADDYCPDAGVARGALGLDGPKAEEEIERLLAVSTSNRSPVERRRLAALFLATGDPSSAMVQWMRLPRAERVADSSLTAALVEYLAQRESRLNEDTIVAVPLAVRLGHERVYPVDDHTGDRASGPIDEAVYAKELPAIWNNRWGTVRQSQSNEWDRRVAAGGDVIGWYRWLNSAEAARLAVANDFGAAAGARVTGNTGRKYLAYWETRNMRMAANIREVVGPGGRVLAIVGASHKPYYERYLAVSSDLVIADLAPVLR